MTMKPLVIGCAVAALLASSAAAQGLGGGLGVGLGAGSDHGAGLGASAGAGASADIRTGLDTGMDMSGAGNAVGAAAATTQRGAADVLPQTNASAQGVTQGSRSSVRAAAAGAHASEAAATTEIRSGALIKNSSGATVGRITQVLDATADAPARVVVRVGNRTVTVPRSELSVDGNFLLYSGAALR
jgi:hypothetical protein